MLALANIHSHQAKGEKKGEHQASHDFNTMINMLFGEAAPAVLIRSVTRRLNKRMYSKMFKAFTDLNSEENIFKKFA